MTKKLILFFILCWISSVVFAFSPWTGKDLLNYCEVSLDIHDNNMGRVQIESEYLQGLKAGACEGFLRGIIETHSKQICIPEANSRLVNIAVMVKYLKDHPEQQSSPASVLATEAYEKYFPCAMRRR